MQPLEHRLFTVFDAAVAERLVAGSERVELAEGQFLFLEGDAADAVYAVLDGKIELCKRVTATRWDFVAFAQASEYFGELGVLDGQGRSTGARAALTSSLIRVPASLWLRTLQEAPGKAALDIFGKIINNVRETNERFMQHKLSQEKLSLVGEMAGSIVHDLRGPYSGIKLAVEMIREAHDDDETRELTQLVTEEIRRSLSMLDELLQFARGTPSLNRQPVDLAELIAKFQRLNRATLAHVDLQVEAMSQLVDVDQDKVLRVLQNLVNNALEAFGSRQGTISLKIARSGEWAEIHVGDNGPGIPEAIRAKLFQPFVTHGKKNGTGLGMAITKSIVEAHGGHISVDTKTGEGTTFVIRLPVTEP